MQTTVTWSELWTVIGALVVLGGILSSFMAWLWQKHAAHDQALADFKIKVAENYVTLTAITQLERRFETAIENLGTKVDRLGERLGAAPARDR